MCLTSFDYPSVNKNLLLKSVPALLYQTKLYRFQVLFTLKEQFNWKNFLCLCYKLTNFANTLQTWHAWQGFEYAFASKNCLLKIERESCLIKNCLLKTVREVFLTKLKLTYWDKTVL